MDVSSRISLAVLLVEDNDDDAQLVLRILRKAGYAPLHQRVETADSLLTALSERHWDIVISDFNLPGFSGLQALDLVRRSGIDLPFILVSGAIGEETAVQAMKAGAHDYVMKDNLTRLPMAVQRELREAEERRARHEAEEEIIKLSRALMQSASLVMITDPIGTIEYLNDAFLRVTGYHPDDLLGQDVVVLGAQDGLARHFAAARSNGTLEAEWRGELLNARKNGAPYWVSVTLSVVRGADGAVSNLLIVMEDISIRKQLETELQQYTHRLEMMVEERTAQLRGAKDQIEIILNNSSDAIAMAGSGGDIVRINPAFRRMFGSRVEQAIEHLLTVIEEPRQVERVAQAIVSVMMEENDQARVEASITGSDGVAIDVDAAMAPVRHETDDRAGLVLSLRDITYLKDIDRFKSRFVAHAAHDLGNPITTLKMRLYLLERMPERLKEHLSVLTREVERLETLVTELRTLSELDRGVVTLRRTSTDLNMLVYSVLEAHQPLAADREQNLQFSLAPRLPDIKLDPRKFERVIVNLLSNALRYTPNGGDIHLSTLAAEGGVSLLVRDSGIGIDQEELPFIFERFYRSDRARQIDSGGTGLGLAIVREVVEAHGGRITVDSAINQGTTFTVWLPVG